MHDFSDQTTKVAKGYHEAGRIDVYLVAYTVKRCTWLRTLQIDVAANFIKLYESTNIEIIRASLDESVSEARALLHDLLMILMVQYDDYCKLAEFKQPNIHSRLDVAFSGCSQL
uniref:Uncharacterized protein n=1 Tax=Physcomitrium patens TaxID=3218 RepID=A0A2K1ID61_PHYPA|nr:hypothetical protein PHYPA_030700 [Physcomitrium patens]